MDDVNASLTITALAADTQRILETRLTIQTYPARQEHCPSLQSASSWPSHRRRASHRISSFYSGAQSWEDRKLSYLWVITNESLSIDSMQDSDLTRYHDFYRLQRTRKGWATMKWIPFRSLRFCSITSHVHLFPWFKTVRAVHGKTSWRVFSHASHASQPKKRTVLKITINRKRIFRPSRRVKFPKSWTLGRNGGKSVISRVFKCPFSGILNQGFSLGSIPNVPII